jgi:phosphatidylserine/phosphatidylglycerophosphate/cardiolipin synthase-like enzyme
MSFFRNMIIITLCLAGCRQGEKPQPAVSSKPCAGYDKPDTLSIRHYVDMYVPQTGPKSAAYILEEGDAAMIARAWMTGHARKTIDIQYFIFSLDNVGLIACDYLVRAADRGVKVRILVDDVMVEAEPEDILAMDHHPNIEIRIYNPGTNIGKNITGKAMSLATDFRGINQRMHNKTFIVDGLAAITGGRNIADEYFDYDHEYNFRDRDILLLGKSCQDVQASFDLFWNDGLAIPVGTLLKDLEDRLYPPDMYDDLHAYACDTANYWPQVRKRVADIPHAIEKIAESGELILTDSILFVSDLPGKNDGKEGLGGGGNTTTALITLLEEAKESVFIQSPYLVTTDLSRGIFSKLTKRGVKIHILTNSLASTDNLEAFSGYQRDRARLLESGVRVYEFRPDADCRNKLMTGSLQKTLAHKPVFGLHAKSMVIDGKIAVVGSFNLDPRSANLNTECITVVRDLAMAKRLEAIMKNEILPENAWETTAHFNPDHKVSLSKRIKTRARRIVPKDIL